jgi:glycosyltransferase involved in cell wall biosynthesis
MNALRILMVSHVPLVRELGAGRAQLDLAEDLRRLGHEIAFYDVRNAFPNGRRGRRFRPDRFGEHAAAFIRSRAGRFDVVDAHHGVLPYTKRDLGLDGLLVARSSGLYAFYAEFARHAAATWPALIPGTAPGQALQRLRSRQRDRDCRRSLQECDFALLLTDDEVTWANRELGVSDRWVAVPHGLREKDATALAAARRPAEDRQRQCEVSFVGSWSLRKGSADWPEIIDRVLERVPRAKFRFLGTGAEPEALRREGVTVVPSYRPEELPELLATATVGALPSYAEGWPFGLLEQLASGLPCVAYDIPGPRSMLRPFGPSALAPRGNAAAFANRIADVLLLEAPVYAALSTSALEVADRFQGLEVAGTIANHYASRLDEVREARVAG